LNEAIETYDAPEICNIDQGSQFTSEDFAEALKDRDIRISMDGKGPWRDNVFVERLRRTVKYEEVYLRPMTPSRRPEAHWPAIWTSTTPAAHTHDLTG